MVNPTACALCARKCEIKISEIVHLSRNDFSRWKILILTKMSRKINDPTRNDYKKKSQESRCPAALFVFHLPVLISFYDDFSVLFCKV